MTLEERLMTAHELLNEQPLHQRSELVNGRMLVREPAAYAHGRLAIVIGSALHAWVSSRGLGDVVAAETGFTLRRNPDTVRAPDAAYISAQRVPPADIHGFAELAPDLVVEVVSPSDRAGYVRQKVGDWLAAGAQLVWVLDAAHRRADVFRADGTTTRLTAVDSLSGEGVLPGFLLPLQPLIGA